VSAAVTAVVFVTWPGVAATRSTVEQVESVPQSKKASVSVAPTVREPFNVAVDVPTEVAALVVTPTESNAVGLAPMKDPPRAVLSAASSLAPWSSRSWRISDWGTPAATCTS
jgi:hypothetical protein